MIKKTIFSIVVGTAIAFDMASCQYKDFDEYDSTVPVKVVVDYGDCPTFDIPLVTRVLFYPLPDMDNPYICDIKDSAVVNLPTGLIQAFAYNNNSEINRTRGVLDAKVTPVIYTGKADSRGIYRKDSLDNTVYYDYPDVTYSTWATMKVTGNDKISKPDDNRVVLHMQKVTRPIAIEIQGIKNASFINSIRMSLSGIQQDYSPMEGFENSYVTIVADGEIDTKDQDKGKRSVFDGKTVIDTLYSSFNIFGTRPQKHILNVFLDGGNWHKVLSYDVTAQINSQTEKNDIIRVKVDTDHDIKEDVAVQGGFDIRFSDWDDNEVPIDMK